ncbi:MAG: putative DNA-binding domain-containing protein [Alphaproteobacteria bacterium]|nr:putative DNA-binding domain-containing protein [Alphaproteobacteria bacterium]MCB9691172.1 putative DNA-binding domain-containing protein [Alphaproteobacteria bacterium]
MKHSPELPTDWRDRMVQLVSGQVPADGALFAGGPTLTPEQQIGIYRGQYVLRLTEAIEDDLLGLRALVGRPTLHAWVLDYLREHPSRSWTLNRASRGFADWLAERDPEPLHLEMARIDTAVQTGIVAAEGAPLTLADLASLPDLALPPHLTLLRHTTNAHALRGALLTGGDVPPTATGDFPVAVYRRGIAMKSEVLDPAAWAVLRSIGDGLGVLEALDGVVRAGLVAPSEVEGAVAGWFRLFASEGLVTRRET